MAMAETLTVPQLQARIAALLRKVGQARHDSHCWELKMATLEQRLRRVCTHEFHVVPLTKTYICDGDQSVVMASQDMPVCKICGILAGMVKRKLD